MDTLEILGADNLAHGRWGEQKLVVRLAHQERPTAARCGCIWRKISCIFLMVKQDNEYE